MKRELVVLPHAADDIEHAVKWYEAEEPGLGRDFFESVNRLLSRIEERPFQFPEIAEGVRRGLTTRFPYAVFFHVGENRIAILAVLHLRQHPDTWRSRT